jgi:propanediol dehydratase small subunit
MLTNNAEKVIKEKSTIMNSSTKIENTTDKTLLKARMAENLKKTFDLIELHHGLKFALYKKLYPMKSDDQLLCAISRDNLKRKQASWIPRTI